MRTCKFARIHCASAMSVDIRRGAGGIYPCTIEHKLIIAREMYVCRAGSPVKQAVGILDSFRGEPDQRRASATSVTIFSDTYRTTVPAECEWGAVNVEYPTKENKKK